MERWPTHQWVVGHLRGARVGNRQSEHHQPAELPDFQADDWEEAAMLLLTLLLNCFHMVVGTIHGPWKCRDGHTLWDWLRGCDPRLLYRLFLGLLLSMEVFGTGVEHSLHAYAAEIKHRLRVNMTDAVGVAVKSIGSGTRRAYATAELMSVFNELYQNLPDAIDCSGLPMNQVLEGDASLSDWGSVLSGAFIVSALDLAGCLVFRALYRAYLVDYVYEAIGSETKDAIQEHACSILGFWSGGNIDLDDCAAAVQGATADDVRAGVQQIEDFLRAIDNQDDEESIRIDTRRGTAPQPV